MEQEINKKNLESAPEKKKSTNLVIGLLIAGLVFFIVGLVAFLVLARDKFAGDGLPWILIALAVVLILGIVAVIVAIKKKGKHEPDYYAFFVMGLIWTLSGIPMMFSGVTTYSSLFIMGLVFLAIGLANKDKWKKHKKWHELSPEEKSMKKWIMIILGILVLAGLLAFFYTAKGF